MFIDLHYHSCFSFLDSYGTVDQIVDKAKDLGREAVAITDHGNISAHPRLEKKCKEEGIKPIFGCEFYILPDISNNTRKKYHITVLAENDKGYQNLLNLATYSWSNFYYKPTLDVKSLLASSDGLVIMSGCNNSIFNGLIRDGKVDKAEKLFKLFRDSSNFYIEIQPFDVFSDVINTLMSISVELGIPVVPTCDIHYFDENQHNIQKMFHCIAFRKRWDEIEFNMPINMYPKSWMQIVSDFESMLGPFDEWDWAEMLGNVESIANSCNAELPKNAMVKLGDSSIEKLKKDAWEGLENRGIKDDHQYTNRLKYELDLIESKEFQDYFLVVADMVNWAKDNGVLTGPARGSSASSLVCYALRITEIDPLKHDLLFERFIDVNRTDLPDIDIDFDDEGRGKVVGYLENKYGEENIGKLATFAEFRGKNSLEETGKIFDIPRKAVERLKPLVLQKESADERASFTIADTIATSPIARGIISEYPKLKVAKFLEGQLRHLSSSAAGYLIVNDLHDYCASYKDTISWDKEDVDYLGLMKLDLLALHTLSIIKLIMERIGWKAEDVYKIPLDDERTLQGFKNNNTIGIFQFGGEIVTSILIQLKNIDFFTLRDINALGRPGPISSKSVSEYLQIRNGDKELPSVHPLYDDITRETSGQVIYQEQVMRILREIGNMAWEDTNSIRKAISKSMGAEFIDKFRDKFISGAESQGIDVNVAEDIWNKMYSFGKWAFNKSHAVSYSALSFWCMYFKVHYPKEFYWAAINLEKDDKTRTRILVEAHRNGTNILPPDINKSDSGWTMDDEGVRAGLASIKGIGPKVCQEIINNRPYDSMEDMREKCNKRVLNKRYFEILVNSGINDGSFTFPFLEEAEKLEESGRDRKIVDLYSPSTGKIEVKIAGFIKRKFVFDIVEESKGRNYEISNPEIKNYCVMTIEDETGSARAKIGRFDYQRFADKVWSIGDDQMCLIKGMVKSNSRVIDVKGIEIL